MGIPISSRMPPLVIGRIDFRWIGQGWALFSARAGVWIGATLLCFLLNVAVWLLVAIPTGVLADLQHQIMAAVALRTPPPSTHPYQDFALNDGIGILLAGFGTILIGGLNRMALRQLRGEAISVAGVFSAFPQALPLLAIGIVIPTSLSLLESLCLWLLHPYMRPAIAISVVNSVDSIPALILPVMIMFAPLLVVNTGATAGEAIRTGLGLLRGQWLKGTAFYIVVSLMSGAGALFCGIGMLITYPLALLSIAVGYFALTQPPAEPSTDFETPTDPGVWPPPPRVQ